MRPESDRRILVERFRALHVAGMPLVMPNPWDLGSARILVVLGAQALGTTSAGFAGSRGRPDGRLTREEALAHAAELAAAVDVPVSADLENGFGDSPEAVAETVRRAAEVGLAGCSIEDWDPVGERTYDLSLAVERVAAAAEVVRSATHPLVLTARADGAFHGEPDLDDAVRRLVAFAEAGAHVVYAPGYDEPVSVRTLVAAVPVPLNVLALSTAPAVSELASMGVARVSTGSGLYWAAMGGLVAATHELFDQGSYGYWPGASRGQQVGRRAFGG